MFTVKRESDKSYFTIHYPRLTIHELQFMTKYNMHLMVLLETGLFL